MDINFTFIKYYINFEVCSGECVLLYVYPLRAASGSPNVALKISLVSGVPMQ